MSWQWNDPIDETFNFQDAGVLTKFSKAIRERELLFDATLSYPEPDVTPGTDVQARVAKLAVRFSTLAIVSLPTVPYAPPGLYWVDPENRFTDRPATGERNGITMRPYLLSHMLAQLGYSTTSHMRRLRVREIETTSSTLDVHSNPVANGMVARHLTTRRTYVRVDGAWVEQVGPIVPGGDLLDSENASPNRCTPGSMQVGDVIWWGWFKMVRDLLNKMKWMNVQSHTRLTGANFFNPALDVGLALDPVGGIGEANQGAGFTTEDVGPAIRAEAESQFDNIQVNQYENTVTNEYGDGFVGLRASGAINASSGPKVYSWQLQAPEGHPSYYGAASLCRHKFKFSNFSTTSVLLNNGKWQLANHRPRSLHLWVYAYKPSNGFGTGAVGIFHSHSDPVTENEVYDWTETTKSQSVILTSEQWPNNGIRPEWGPIGTTSDDIANVSYGYCSDLLAVAIYDFEFGEES